jgi:hypothetical protein
MLQKFAIAIFSSLWISAIADIAHARPEQKSPEDLEIDRQIINSSPVLRRWLNNPPDLLEDIYHTPSFEPKLQIGMTSRNHSLGLEVGVEDVFVGRTPLTLNANLQTELSGRESEIQAGIRYYLLPLGSYWNIAPIAGYRQFNQYERPQISGLDVGLQGILILSPRSSDLRLSHTFTSPYSNLEMSKTVLSTSYAVTRQMRLGTKIEWRRSPLVYDSRVGFLVEISF